MRKTTEPHLQRQAFHLRRFSELRPRNIVQFIVCADPTILDDTKGLPKGWSLLETDTPCEVGMKYTASTGTFA